MALDCDLLTGDIGACTDVTSKGFAQKAQIGNFSEIATKTVSGALVTALTLTSPKTTHEVIVKGLRPFEEMTVTGAEKKTGMVFSNAVTIHLKGLTPANSALAKTLSNGVFFMILTQLGTVTNEKYPAPGIQAGLKCSEFTWNAEEGAYVATLTENMADMPLLFIWDTNIGTTDALVEGLLS
jgi:hypothetical protein